MGCERGVGAPRTMQVGQPVRKLLPYGAHRTVCGGMKSDDCAADATAAGVLCCLEGNMTIVNASKGVLEGRGI